MILKPYQIETLDWLERFFKLCKETNDPARAYEETTRLWRGTALHYAPLPVRKEVPYICLRIPTGGGKTLVGGLAIERANRSLLFTQNSLTLWLVPSEPIREQTLKALRAPENLLHQAVFSSLGEVTVQDIEEAKRIKPAVLNASNVIIVATMQSFKQEEMDRLSVYKQNSEMMPHFESVSDPAVRGNCSVVDVFRMHHPFVIVDEAHNQGTPLAFDTLARFEPAAILELTATPDRVKQPSNVLFSVGASELQDAEMIKLPLDLVRRERPEDTLRDAIACLHKLQHAADDEFRVGGDYLRPIMLLQAERHDAERETFTPEKVKAMLMSEAFGIPEEEIAIATGTLDEIDGEDILSKDSRRRFIVTIDKLREGWDCPFAYVLCSFRNTRSSTAAEQILGRILRMPGAKRREHQELNEAYAFVTSESFQETVRALHDGLVKNGFEHQEAVDLIHAVEARPEDDLFSGLTTVTFAPPELPLPEELPSSLAGKVEIAPEAGTITIKERLSTRQVKELEGIFKTEQSREIVHRKIEEMEKPRPVRPVAPSDRGEEFHIPLLAVQQGDLWEPFEETHLLQSDWRILDYSSELGEKDFQPVLRRAEGGRFLIREEHLKFEYFTNMEADLALFDYQEKWDRVRLVSWLERQIPEDSIPSDEKAAFLNRAVGFLLEKRGFSLEELNYSKFRLRAALEAKIQNVKAQAMETIYYALLSSDERFLADGRCELIFRQGHYACDFYYQGYRDLPKHFFPVIGNLRPEGEELECAAFLATQLPGVKYWVRNVERKPGAFSLQTGTDRFYPDFICQMGDGRVLVVEYKGVDRWDSPDSVEKRQIGALWERRSKGKGLFIMPKGQDWEVIRQKVGGRS